MHKVDLKNKVMEAYGEKLTIEEYYYFGKHNQFICIITNKGTFRLTKNDIQKAGGEK